MIPFDEYYWELKYGFQGDSEFSLETYWKLPWAYVLNAISRLRKMRLAALHEEEVPISVLAWQQSEINRDRKKQRDPAKLSDFFLYADSSTVDTVDAIYGATAVKLAEMKEFPSWALFAWKDLVKNAEHGTAPTELYYRDSNCIVLAPQIADGHVRGFLLAKKGLSGKEVLLFSSKFKPIRVRIPKLEGEVAAIENCYLEIVRYS